VTENQLHFVTGLRVRVNALNVDEFHVPEYAMNVYEIKRWSHHYRIALTVLTPTPVTVAVSAKMIDRSCCIPHVYVRDAFNS